MKAIAYLRVSTQEQGNSRLGLEAQRAAVEAFAKAEGIKLLVVVVVFLALAIVAVGLRIWARRIKRSKLQWNDYSIILALV